MTEAAPSTGSALLDDIVARVGWDDMCRFARVYGGQKVFFPKNLPDDHHLVINLGRPLAEAMAAEYQHDRIEVPSRFAREIEVLSLARQIPRLTTNQIVEQTKLAYRDVQRIIAASSARNPRR
jgi:hypothetical protein